MENIKEYTPDENKMGVKPMGRLLAGMAIPMIASMIVQALYNIVDSIFVARLSENALTAVSLAFPLQNLMFSLGVGTSVGVNALISRFLGAKNFDKANSVATHGIWLALFTTGGFMALTALIQKPFFAGLTDDPEIYDYSIQYMSVVGFLCAGVMFQVMLEKILQSTGRTMLTMITQMTGAVINLILDPIMIFGMFGFPALGVTGAALATVIGQFAGAILAFILCVKKNPDVHISLTKYKPSGHIIKSIYKISIPSIILQSMGSIMSYGVNIILVSFSSTAVAVFGVFFKLMSFIFLPIFGLNNAVVPIVAYNFGAKNVPRIRGVMIRGYIIGISIGVAGLLAYEFVPEALLSLFDASPEMIEIGRVCLRITGIMFPLTGFSIISSACFQAFGFAIYAMVLSIVRQLAVLLPVANILAAAFGLDAVWWAFPAAEGVAVILTLIFLGIVNKKAIHPLMVQDKMKANAAV